MKCVLLAERAVLFQNKPVGIVLLVLDAVIISMLAFRAFECNFGSCRFCCHIENSIQKNYTPLRCVNKVYHTSRGLSILFERKNKFFFGQARFFYFLGVFPPAKLYFSAEFILFRSVYIPPPAFRTAAAPVRFVPSPRSRDRKSVV